MRIQANDYRVTVQQRPPQPVLTVERAPGVPAGDAALLDPLEIESLMLNMDASLRVHARHHFFGWTQGMLQSLVRHELLVCALRSAEPLSFQVDSFATPLVESSLINGMFHRDASVVPQIVKLWEDSQFRPVAFDAETEPPFAGSAFAAEMQRVGATRIFVHGTYDALGKPASLFIFACQPEGVGPRQAKFVELIAPFLHLAWMRVQINRPLEDAGAAWTGADLLTVREEEILHWIHVGKSNIEIGTILQISPFTVKNHVQKILRKLDVQNRTQAVGKALALRILNI